eukprot:CAMPEP_0170078056 /NCGR_PEP_ID=MMETSP0019_2-20121128/14731_1 /TAXON_ID=98059 /ORGANISM="Dinobryon sp., Strain UTEXLB2267" /LENGTH=170 /DNA_ID=CAMNT_0010290719 /DNA_START=125 /DNA_END=634 /DNA_ORIENTATION=-
MADNSPVAVDKSVLTVNNLKTESGWHGDDLNEEHKLKRLLKGKVDDEDIDKLVEDIENLYVDTSTVGGVYIVQIVDFKKNPIIFKSFDKVDPDLVLIKIGRADNYTKRFAQFGFGYNVVMQINGDNLMEKWFKQELPANFMKAFFEHKTKVASVLKCFRIPGTNSAPTEW